MATKKNTRPPTRIDYDVKRLRESFHLTQKDFWMPLGITQSAGSRYEHGRTMPRAVWLLIRQFYLRKDPALEPDARPARPYSRHDDLLVRYLRANPGLRSYLLARLNEET